MSDTAPLTFDSLVVATALFSETPMAVALFEGHDLLLRFGNGKWLAYLGENVQIAPLFGRSLEEIISVGERELIALSRCAMATGRVERFEELRVGTDLGEKWLTGVIKPLEERGMQYVLMQFHDVTREVRAIEDIRRASTFADEVLEQIPYPVFVLSARGELIRSNNRARTRLWLNPGLCGEGIIGAMELRDENGHQVEVSSLPIVRALRGDMVEMRASVRDRLLGDRRDCILYGAPVYFDNKVSAALGTAIDVTELRRLERAKDEFLNIAAHELKTPLTSLRAYVQLAIRKGLTHSQAPELINGALHGTYRMERLINDMLDSTRIETGRLQLQMERCDLSRVVRDVVIRHECQSGRERIVELTSDSSLLIDGDPIRLDQIVSNLLSNAIRHGHPERPIRINCLRDRNYALIEVIDFGEGIDEADIPHLFERFFRGARAKEDGLGLGLYIAKELVEIHGGKIGVETSCERGTCFFFRMPLAS